MPDLPALENIPRVGETDVLAGIMSGVFFVLGLVAVGFIIYAGIKMQLSRGNASDMVQARSMLIYSIVGLIVAGAAWAIVNFVLRGLGG